MARKADEFFGMNVRPVIAVSGRTVFEVHRNEQTLSDPFVNRDDAIAHMFHLADTKGTDSDPLAHWWPRIEAAEKEA